MALSIILFFTGLCLVIFFAEKLVEGVVGTSRGFGVSAFLISVVFIGFDPENLALGAVASFEGVAGIALGSIIGAAMVSSALAFGITAVAVPMNFERSPKRIIVLPLLAVLLLAILSYDGLISRIDGILLIAAFFASLLFLWKMSKTGLDIRPTGELAEALEETSENGTWKPVILLIVSLAAIIAGSEMLVSGSVTLITRLGLSDTVFGMTILALLVSIEELARELPAALKGRPDISYGNVAGSVLAFFLCNAGIIALVEPIPVSESILSFYLPFCFMTQLLISAFMLKGKFPRWAGIVLILLYSLFFVGSYLI